MWIITIRSPNGEPKEYSLRPGSNSVGRMAGNDIVILDSSASRYHARIEYNDQTDSITIHDLDSTNGTYVNRDRITTPRKVLPTDIIRIGQHLLEASYWEENNPTLKAAPHKTAQLTRELILESLDQHAVLLAEVASRLNTMLDLDTALREVSDLMKASMAADRCEVILAEEFGQIAQLGFATTIAQQALETRSAVVVQDATANPSMSKSAYLLRIHAAMCVPIISNNEILGLIYVFKNRARARPFEHRDLQLAIAISHQAALTIQRMKLLEKATHEEFVSKLLQRFLSPQEAQYVLKEYFENGELPQMSEYNLTILTADICESTCMAERLGARRFSRVLSRYYKEMTDVIFEHHGMLNKYIGDGLMAIFGLPHQPPDAEERAVKAAITMLEHLRNMNATTDEPINIGIGINTGPAMAGYLGSLEYVEFAVMGYPVNIAWGLEAHARPNRIFIGHPTYQALAGKFPVKALDPVPIKKQIEAIQAYEIILPA
ncbi:MAG: FHA domain-containing protein [Anaerolineales bacterium]|nr:FHA domain-containing protein [Anaerolineales bacterium]